MASDDEVLAGLDREIERLGKKPKRRPRQLAGQSELALPTEVVVDDDPPEGQTAMRFDG